MNKLLNNVFWAPDEGSAAAAGADTSAPQPSAPADNGSSSGTVAEGAEPSIADVLNFDPFEEKPEKAPKTPATPAKQPEPKGKQAAPAAATTPAAPAGNAAPVLPAKSEPAVTMADLQKLLSGVVAPKATDGKPAEKAKRFNVALPSQVHAAIMHEDPAVRERAFNGLISATMNTVFEAVEDHIEKVLMPRVTNLYDQRESFSQQRQSVAQDFYTKFPQLNTPQYRNFVAMAATQKAQAQGQAFKGWTPEFRDEVGNELMALFKLAAAPAAPVATVPAAPPAKPRYNGTGAGARVPAAPVNDIMDTIFGRG